MATVNELTLVQVIRTAEGVRQAAKAAAFATFQAASFAGSALATYVAALAAADDAFQLVVNGANNTALGYTIPNSGTPNPGNINAGQLGMFGPIGGNIAGMGAIA